MKMSQWLREWQLTEAVPEVSEAETGRLLAFWAGWLVGPSHAQTVISLDDSREMAIRAAEFIESQARGS